MSGVDVRDRMRNDLTNMRLARSMPTSRSVSFLQRRVHGETTGQPGCRRRLPPPPALVGPPQVRRNGSFTEAPWLLPLRRPPVPALTE